MLPERGPAVAVDRPHGVGAEQSLSSPAAVVGHQTEVDPAHAVDEPHLVGDGGGRPQRTRPVLRFDEGVGSGERLLRKLLDRLEAHAVVGGPGVGSEHQHRPKDTAGLRHSLAFRTESGPSPRLKDRGVSTRHRDSGDQVDTTLNGRLTPAEGAPTVSALAAPAVGARTQEAE